MANAEASRTPARHVIAARRVVNYATSRPRMHTHERATFMEVAKRLAALQGFEFAGDYESARDYRARLYYVPDDTLLSEVAVRLNIRDENDVFGGVVPFQFSATKIITHARLDQDAVVPHGWSDQFAERVGDVVHRGLSAFSEEDAYRSGVRLLERGPIRLKPSRESGASGQIVIKDIEDLRSSLDAFDDRELRNFGLVLEENLEKITTCSVGSIRTAGLTASYYGTQDLTPNNVGALVYGGSKILVVRGSFQRLLEFPLAQNAHLAVKQAVAYDTAARDVFPDLILSRCNYDVGQGWNAQGQWRSGVLEQSWRVGGATGAEIAAIEALQNDSSLNVVSTLCIEKYGQMDDLPPTAVIYFRGIDEQVGPLTKYAMRVR
jgi:hypothetical protein